jgi:Family of unknown function (DUF6159)
MSFFDNIGNALKFLVECFRMIAEEPKLLLPSLCSVVLGFVLFVLFLIPFILIGLFDRLGFYVFGGAAVVLLFISFALSYVFMGATSYAVYQHLRFGKSSLGEAFNRALGSIVTLLLLAVTGAVIKMIASSARNRSNRGGGIVFALLGSIVAGVPEQGWQIAVSLLVPVAVIAQLGYIDTFKKSFEIVRNNLVIVGAGEVAVRLLTGVIGFFGVVISVGLGVGLFFLAQGAIGSAWAAGFAVLLAFAGIALATTLTTFIRISYYTQVYVWAEDHMMHEQDGRIVAPPVGIRNAFNF